MKRRYMIPELDKLKGGLSEKEQISIDSYFDRLQDAIDLPVYYRNSLISHFTQAFESYLDEGKKADEISLEGRIVAVADVYDALTSKRSYKEAWDEERAYEEILKGKGTQFDPEVVDAFTRAHDKINEVRLQLQDA